MDLRPIIDRIARQADEFLAGASDRREARAGIAEQINADYGTLPPADREKVTRGVMDILEREGFFETNRAGSEPGPEADHD